MRARVSADVVARAVARLAAVLADDADRFAPLELVVEDYPEGYDPDETPDARR